MLVYEVVQYSNYLKKEPLEYVLTMTSKDYVRYEMPFIKCLELNDIKLKQGEFDNSDLKE